MQKEADCTRWNLISIPIACNQKSELKKNTGCSQFDWNANSKDILDPLWGDKLRVQQQMTFFWPSDDRYLIYETWTNWTDATLLLSSTARGHKIDDFLWSKLKYFFKGGLNSETFFLLSPSSNNLPKYNHFIFRWIVLTDFRTDDCIGESIKRMWSSGLFWAILGSRGCREKNSQLP